MQESSARQLGADDAIAASAPFEKTLAPVDLVFDTVGGEVLSRSAAALRDGGRLVSVAEEPNEHPGLEISITYFVVEPSREQLEQLTRVADAGKLRVEIDSVFSLDAACAAFERVQPGENAARSSSRSTVTRADAAVDAYG